MNAVKIFSIIFLILLPQIFLSGCSPDSSEKTKKIVSEKVIVEETIIDENLAKVPLAEAVYQPFPAGYGYMQDTKRLQQAIEDRDQGYIRQHAWKLWAGIMQPASDIDWPLWMTWKNSSVVFQQDPDSANKGDSGAKRVHRTLRAMNKKNAPDVNTPAPSYPVPKWVKEHFSSALKYDPKTETYSVKDGKYFVSNGDIMIATESLSEEGVIDIETKQFNRQAKLNKLHQDGENMLDVSQKTIVTKHMYWPVKQKGVTGIPVWKDNFPSTFAGYVGYEVWNTPIAINPDGNSVGQTLPVSYLYGIENNDGSLMPTVNAEAVVYDLDDFYYHQVTKEDWKAFNDEDKAIIHAASLWANNQPFEIGDYLVSVAMHVNTKEVPSWALQSVWWSDSPDDGIYSQNRPDLPQAKGPWKNYLMTEAYQYQPDEKGDLPIAVNPYIEGVIHPIATNCRNCHVRAGWPEKKKGSTAPGASYQNAECKGLLTALVPEDECFKGIMLTDYLWIIPDRAIKPKKAIED
jgi:hypothetical protein